MQDRQTVDRGVAGGRLIAGLLMPDHMGSLVA
jgi:hypothetical protein